MCCGEVWGEGGKRRGSASISYGYCDLAWGKVSRRAGDGCDAIVAIRDGLAERGKVAVDSRSLVWT